MNALTMFRRMRVCLSVVGAVCFLSFASTLNNSAFAQNAQMQRPNRDTHDFTEFHFNFALHPPNYLDANAVGSHIAFSAMLGKLMKRAYPANSGLPCQPQWLVHDFPDLVVAVRSAPEISPTDLRYCLERIESVFSQGAFEKRDFDAVSRELGVNKWKSDRKWELPSLWVGKDLSALKAAITGQRLSVLGRLALLKMYPHDTVVQTLLNGNDWLIAKSTSFEEFQEWLLNQRSSQQMGIYPRLSKRDSARLLQTGIKAVVPAPRPTPSKPTFAKPQTVDLKAAAAGLLPILLVRCDRIPGIESMADIECESTFTQVFCFGRNDRIPRSANPGARLSCQTIGLSGDTFVRNWIAVESSDERLLSSFENELSSGRFGSNEFFDSFRIDYVVTVRPN